MAHVKYVGVDCAWLAIMVYSEVGLMERVDPGYYPADWAQHRSEELYLDWVLRLAHEVDTPLPGDLVLYHWGRCYSHGAIVVVWPQIIHALIRVGCVILDNGDSGAMQHRERKYYRLNCLSEHD